MTERENFMIPTGKQFKAQCRNEPVFTAVERWYLKGRKFVDCPHCQRRYFFDEATGQYVSDRPLKIME